MSRPIHFEIQADDLERAKGFYADVFGWTYEDYSQVTGAPYWGVLTGPEDSPASTAGLLERPAAPGRRRRAPTPPCSPWGSRTSTPRPRRSRPPAAGRAAQDRAHRDGVAGLLPRHRGQHVRHPPARRERRLRARTPDPPAPGCGTGRLRARRAVPSSASTCHAVSGRLLGGGEQRRHEAGDVGERPPPRAGRRGARHPPVARTARRTAPRHRGPSDPRRATGPARVPRAGPSPSRRSRAPRGCARRSRGGARRGWARGPPAVGVVSSGVRRVQRAPHRRAPSAQASSTNGPKGPLSWGARPSRTASSTSSRAARPGPTVLGDGRRCGRRDAVERQRRPTRATASGSSRRSPNRPAGRRATAGPTLRTACRVVRRPAPAVLATDAWAPRSRWSEPPRRPRARPQGRQSLGARPARRP